VGVTVVVLVAVFFLTRSDSASSQGIDNIKIAKPVVEKAVDQSFEFPIRDSKGEEVSKLKITVEKASLEKEIVVKGKKNTAVDGRVFLILNLKVQNSYDKSVDIKTRDYFRLSVNGNDQEWLAPEIHNDPVTIQAISTKLTRVGFILYEKDKNPILQIGEINGQKEKVELNLKN